MRRLSMRQAQSCENAHRKVCRCRCGGAMHGRGLMSEAQISSLPEDDPHYAQPPVARRTAAQRREDAGQMQLPFDGPVL